MSGAELRGRSASGHHGGEEGPDWWALAVRRCGRSARWLSGEVAPTSGPGLSVAEGARHGRGRCARGETGERGELDRRVESWAARLGRAVREERGELAGLMRELGRGVGCWAGLLAGLGWFTGFWVSFLFPISFLFYFLFNKLSYNYLNSNLNLNSTLTLKQIK